MTWWKNNIFNSKSLILKDNHTHTLSTGSSLLGWGKSIENESTGGQLKFCPAINTDECSIFSLFNIDYLIFIWLTCWYIFISFFPFEYFNFIIYCSLWCIDFKHFYFLLRIKERVHFLPIFILTFFVRVYGTIGCYFALTNNFFTHGTK